MKDFTRDNFEQLQLVKEAQLNMAKEKAIKKLPSIINKLPTWNADACKTKVIHWSELKRIKTIDSIIGE